MMSLAHHLAERIESMLRSSASADVSSTGLAACSRAKATWLDVSHSALARQTGLGGGTSAVGLNSRLSRAREPAKAGEREPRWSWDTAGSALGQARRSSDFLHFLTWPARFERGCWVMAYRTTAYSTVRTPSLPGGDETWLGKRLTW